MRQFHARQGSGPGCACASKAVDAGRPHTAAVVVVQREEGHRCCIQRCARSCTSPSITKGPSLCCCDANNACALLSFTRSTLAPLAPSSRHAYAGGAQTFAVSGSSSLPPVPRRSLGPMIGQSVGASLVSTMTVDRLLGCSSIPLCYDCCLRGPTSPLARRRRRRCCNSVRLAAVPVS